MKWPWPRKQTITAEHEAPAKGIKGATIRLSADSDKYRKAVSIAQEVTQHEEFSNIYEQTVAGSIINTETDDLFAQGWALQGEDPDEVAKVREYLVATNFEIEVKKMAIEAKVYGFGIAEVGKFGNRYGLVAHSSYNIYPDYDADGWLDGFEQVAPILDPEHHALVMSVDVLDGEGIRAPCGAGSLDLDGADCDLGHDTILPRAFSQSSSSNAPPSMNACRYFLP